MFRPRRWDRLRTISIGFLTHTLAPMAPDSRPYPEPKAPLLARPSQQPALRAWAPSPTVPRPTSHGKRPHSWPTPPSQRAPTLTLIGNTFKVFEHMTKPGKSLSNIMHVKRSSGLYSVLSVKVWMQR